MANAGKKIAAATVVFRRVYDILKKKSFRWRQAVIDFRGKVIARKMVVSREEYLGADSVWRRRAGPRGIVAEYLLNRRVEREMKYILRRVWAAYVNRNGNRIAGIWIYSRKRKLSS